MPSIKFETGRDFASAISAADPLAAYRDRFHIPKTWAGSDCVYLCGHSLGLQPKSARAYIEQELEDWAHYGVEGHFHAKNPWMPYHEILTAPTARLVGALPSEVVVMNSLTVNLHLMMVSFYRPTPARNKIVIEANAFPSDQYAVQSQINFHGYDPAKSLIEIAPRPGDTIIRTEDIEKLLTEKGGEIALIILGGVNYYTGQAFDCQRITESAHAQGCVVGFDMAHAAGNLQLQPPRLGRGFRRLVQLQISQRRSRVRCRMFRPRTPSAKSGVAAFCRLVGSRQGQPVPDAVAISTHRRRRRLAVEQSLDSVHGRTARFDGNLRRSYDAAPAREERIADGLSRISSWPAAARKLCNFNSAAAVATRRSTLIANKKRWPRPLRPPGPTRGDLRLARARYPARRSGSALQLVPRCPHLRG